MNIFTEVKEGLAISWDAIRANKLRSGLTTLGIVIGIVTVTMMGTAIEGLNKAFLNSISAIGTDVLYVQTYPWISDEPWWHFRNRRNITYAEGRAFMRNANPGWIVALESVTIKNVRHGDGLATGVVLVGTTEEAAITDGWAIGEGRYLTAGEVDGGRPVCVLGADIANSFFPHGSAIGGKIRIDNLNLEVVGVMEKRGKFLGLENLDNTVHIPITKFVGALTYRPDVRVAVKFGQLATMDDTKEEVRGIMRKVRRLAPGKADDFALNTQEAFVTSFNRLGGVIASIGLFITGLSLFVGGIGIMNIMFVSVAERTREIGIRKAIGAKQRTILLQFLIEAATICLLGGIIGLGIAWAITLAVTRFLPASMSLSIVAIALLVSILTGVLAGFFPAWRAARMNPVDALRSE